MKKRLNQKHPHIHGIPLAIRSKERDSKTKTKTRRIRLFNQYAAGIDDEAPDRLAAVTSHQLRDHKQLCGVAPTVPQILVVCGALAVDVGRALDGRLVQHPGRRGVSWI